MIQLRMRLINLCFCLLFCLNTGDVSANPITATVGTDVTLKCKYDSKHYGRLPFCWGRGSIPNSGCGNEVIKSDGTTVLSRRSERYTLLGDLGMGEAFLTITQVQESDSGIYGCRIDIPGWFNDQKHEITLKVNPGKPFSIKVEMREVRERTVIVRWTPAFDGGSPVTSYRVDLKFKYASWDTAVRTEVSHASLTQVTLVDLRPAKTYNLRMFVVNSVGMSEASNILVFTTKEAAPEGPPNDIQLEAISSNIIKATWKPPKADLQNGVLRNYIISYKEYDHVAKVFLKAKQLSLTATGAEQSTFLTNLKTSTQYSVQVQAKTSAGLGPVSTARFCTTLEEVKATTAANTLLSSTAASTKQMQYTSLSDVHTTSTSAGTESTSTVMEQTSWNKHLLEQTSFMTAVVLGVPPDPPVIVLEEVIGKTISLFWTPGFEGDSPITGFFLQYKDTNASWDKDRLVDFGPDWTTATILENIPSTYNIRMFAKNSHGMSNASNVLTVTIEETGQQKSSVIATMSTINDDSTIASQSSGVHIAAIIVPVVLVLLVGAIIIGLLLQRIKQRKGSLNVWLKNGTIHYKGSDSLEEL